MALLLENIDLHVDFDPVVPCPNKPLTQSLDVTALSMCRLPGPGPLWVTSTGHCQWGMPAFALMELCVEFSPLGLRAVKGNLGPESETKIG